MANKTIDILESAADAVCQHQKQFDPELQGWVSREQALRQAFFQQHRGNRALRRQVLGLLDAQGTVDALERALYFRLGLQMGRELGALDQFPPE